MKYDFCIVITTYNREDMLFKLLDDIFSLGSGYTLHVVVLDDSSDNIIDLSNYDVKYIRFSPNRGKKLFWKTFDDIFKYIKNIYSKYYLFLQDDGRLKPNYFTDAVRIYEGIKDERKISLSTLISESHRNVKRWVDFFPIRYDEYYHTQWVEAFFIAERKFFEVLEFKMNHINVNRWKRNPLLSSGVGQQMSERLFNMKYNMYVVYNSLVTHGDHESVMNPDDRINVRLIAK